MVVRSWGWTTCVNQGCRLFLQCCSGPCRIPPVPSGPLRQPHRRLCAGEKGRRGVGFRASWMVLPHGLLLASPEALSCMEHRGGCGGDSDSGDGAAFLGIPWSFSEAVWPESTRNGCPTAGSGHAVSLPHDPGALQQAAIL